LHLLAQYGDDAKVLSGGQSLMPALNLSCPSSIADTGASPELRRISVSGQVLRIGALTRHADILNSPEIAQHAPLLSEATAHAAHPAILNMSTLGGNLAQADPASEMPACVMALDATIVVQGQTGERRIPAADFFTGMYETVLAPGELLVAVEMPVKRPCSVHFFHEHVRRKGDYAIVGLGASAVLDGDVFAELRLGFFAVGEKPLLATASTHLIGRPVTAAMLAEAQSALDDELDPQEDQQATAGMRRYLARQLMARCVADLLGRPELNSGTAA
jgi:carbon-monoxide dehydrogenase medium subunit